MHKRALPRRDESVQPLLRPPRHHGGVGCVLWVGEVNVEESISKVYVEPDSSQPPLVSPNAGSGTQLFVINLCASIAPVSTTGRNIPGLENYKLYQVARVEDGRTRHRLRLGFFTNEAHAERVLTVVRQQYPTAFTTSLMDEDRRFTRGYVPERSAAPAPAPVAAAPAPVARPVASAPAPAPVRAAVAAPVTAPVQAAAPARVAPAPAPVVAKAAPAPAAAPVAAKPAAAPAPKAAPQPAKAQPVAAKKAGDEIVEMTWEPDEETKKAATSTKLPKLNPITEAIGIDDMSWDEEEIAPTLSNTNPGKEPLAVGLLSGRFAALDTTKLKAAKPAAPAASAVPAATAAKATPPAPQAVPPKMDNGASVRVPALTFSDPVPTPATAQKANDASGPYHVAKGIKIEDVEDFELDLFEDPPTLSPSASSKMPALSASASGKVPALSPSASGKFPALSPSASGRYPALSPSASGRYPALSPAAANKKAPTPPVAAKPAAPAAKAAVPAKPAAAPAKPAVAAKPVAPTLPVAAPATPAAKKIETPAKPAAPAVAAKPAAPAAPAAKAAAPAKPAVPPVLARDPALVHPNLDSTQTIRALTTEEMNDAAQEKWFAIQLAVSDQPVNLDAMPHLDIFEAYSLYSVATAGSGKIVHSLRLGFFKEDVSAEAVTGYLKTFFASPTVIRISVAEQARFKDAPQPRRAEQAEEPKNNSNVVDLNARARPPVVPTVTMEVDPTTSGSFRANASGSLNSATGTFKPGATGSLKGGQFKPGATGAFKLNGTGVHKAMSPDGKIAAKAAAPAMKRSEPTRAAISSTGKHKTLKKSLAEELLEEAREVELSESGIRKMPQNNSLLSRLLGKKK